MKQSIHLSTTLAIAIGLLPLCVNAQTPGSAASLPVSASLSESLSGQAKGDYLAARMLYEDGDAKSAAIKFQASYEASKDPRLLWNMAACEKQQRHYARVETLIQRYLTEGGALITAEDRSNAEALLAAMQPFLASATVVVNEPEARIFVDDQLVGTSPLLGIVRVDLGIRKFRAEKAGFVRSEQSADVKGGNAFAVNLMLTPERHQGTLQIFAGTGERISVDGKPVGVGSFAGVLPSGTHVVEVTGNNKLPYRSEVVVTDNQTNSLRAVLESRPAAKDDGGVPSWVWWVGGAVVVAGAGVGGYFLLRPTDKEASVPQGTMSPGTVWVTRAL